MVGKRIWTDTEKSNSSNKDDFYARFGIKGQTQINDQLVGYGQFEYNTTASSPEGAQDRKLPSRLCRPQFW